MIPNIERDSKKQAQKIINDFRKGSTQKLDTMPTSSLMIDPFKKANKNAIATTNIFLKSARTEQYKFYEFKPKSMPTTSKKHTANPSIPTDCLIDISDEEMTKKDKKVNNSYLLTAIKAYEALSDKSIDIDCNELTEDKDNNKRQINMLSYPNSFDINQFDQQIKNLDKLITDANKNDASNDNPFIILDLVNKKNDLIRRQMQLNILNQQRALEVENENLTEELRLILEKSDDIKTTDELKRQRYLSDKLVELINKRNELVDHLDLHERNGIEDDDAQKKTLEDYMNKRSLLGSKFSQHVHQDQCSIQ